MAESSQSAATGDGGQGDGNDGGGKGTQNTQTVDLKSLPADQLEQVLENPELWNLPRVKELREGAAKAKKLESERQKADEKALEEQNEFKTLAEQRAEQLTTKDKKIQEMQIDQAATNKLVGKGIVDLDAALKLMNRNDIKVDENGNVTGLDEALTSLEKDKAYLFKNGEGSTSVGAASNGDGTGQRQQQQPAKFKRSQLKDQVFYQANKAAIIEAAKNGQIEDDITPR